MIKVTAQQRANAIEALEVMWPSVPPENVNLWSWTRDYSNKTHCNTIACFGGWCARWPNFIKQGIKLDTRGTPLYNGMSFSISSYLFGSNDLFLLPHTWEKGNDHEIVTKRLQHLIANSEVIGD